MLGYNMVAIEHRELVPGGSLTPRGFFSKININTMLAIVLVPLALSGLLYLVMVTGRRAKNLPPGKYTEECMIFEGHALTLDTLPRTSNTANSWKPASNSQKRLLLEVSTHSSISNQVKFDRTK